MLEAPSIRQMDELRVRAPAKPRENWQGWASPCRRQTGPTQARSSQARILIGVSQAQAVFFVSATSTLVTTRPVHSFVHQPAPNTSSSTTVSHQC